jgi:hypothetical protein
MITETILSLDEFQEHLINIKNIPRYDPSTEGKIPHPWWDVDKFDINTRLKDISEKIASCTQGAIGLDKELQHVANTATKIEQVGRGSTVKVALIGAQGAGKSLLINDWGKRFRVHECYCEVCLRPWREVLRRDSISEGRDERRDDR